MGKSRIIKLIQEVIYYLRVQNYHEGCMRFRVLLTEMQSEANIKEALCEEQSELLSVVSQMLQALEYDDLILLADLLEEALLPLIKTIICPKQPITRNKYQLEITSSGYMTVKHLESDLYLHSNGNPMEEARQLVQLCYDPKKERYAVWGVGLGYHILRLYEEARGAIEISIFDEDEEIIQLAQESGVLKDIPPERIKYVVDENGSNFAECIAAEEIGILLHFPSIKKIQKQSLREIMNQFFASWNGTVQLRTELLVNFRNNQNKCRHNVDELKEHFQNREVVIVGAGPSLDATIDFVRDSQGKRMVVAVTTVWKKLLSAGIVPDFFVVMDSQMRTIRHIEGVERTDIPLIVDSTAYWEFADRCEGEKYIVYQKGFEDADVYAKMTGNEQYETGGSVTTLALEVALKLGAKSIYLVGVDLAYPNGLSHADGTMDQKKRDTAGMKRVKSVSGEWVYADSLFDSYRKWIENKIAMYPHVEYFNLSTCGAQIAGTIRLE